VNEKNEAQTLLHQSADQVVELLQKHNLSPEVHPLAENSSNCHALQVQSTEVCVEMYLYSNDGGTVYAGKEGQVRGRFKVQGHPITTSWDYNFLKKLEKWLERKYGGEFQELEETLKKSASLLWKNGESHVWLIKDTNTLVIVDPKMGLNPVHLKSVYGEIFSRCTPKGFVKALQNAIQRGDVQTKGLEGKND